MVIYKVIKIEPIKMLGRHQYFKFKNLFLNIFGFFCILVIIFSAVFVFLNAESLKEKSDWLREVFIKNYYIKNIFNLHDVGNAKYFLLSPSGAKEINVDLYSSEFGDPVPETKEFLEDIFKKYCGSEKKININSKKIYLGKSWQMIDDKELDALSDIHIHPKNNSKSASISIVYLSEYGPNKNRIGLATNDLSVVIFKDAIQKLSDRKSVLEKIERATLLHEIGHLWGLEHNDNSQSVMSDIFECPAFALPNQIVADFNAKDIFELNKIK